MTLVDNLTETNLFHPDLSILKALVYDRCGISLTNYKVSKESVEYGACSFKLNGRFIEHRISKITPTKVGQFVTIWKRSKDGDTEPFDIADNLDFMLITAKTGTNLGQFVLPKSLLIEKGIISHKGNIGKRGMRVYPPWDMVTNKQAENTQSWQVKYFVEIKDNNLTNLDWMGQSFCQKENYKVK